jgi:L-alanine-DL-glutamate epimerase-like enolase superfamily enzyme
MQINSVELFFVKVPLETKAPGFFAQPNYFEPSWIPGFRQSEMRMYLLKLGVDSGQCGYAAMPAMGSERRAMGPLLGNYFLGIDPLDIQLVNQRIQEFSYIGMRNGWIDAAVWDLIGKILQKPLWELLGEDRGGAGGSVAPYMSTGATHGHDPAKATSLAKLAVDEGYQGIKLRVKGTEIQPMVDYIAAARDAAGAKLQVMVDANQGWPVDIVDITPKWSLEFATEFAQAIEPCNVRWLEEPLNRGNFEGLAALRVATRTPIAGAEMNSSWRDFMAMLDAGSLDIYQPDAVLVGGTYAGGISVTHWLIEEMIRRNNEGHEPEIEYCPHTWTTGLGFAVALQLVGSLPPAKRSLLEYPVEGHWEPRNWARFIKGGFERDNDGLIQIPDGPGLGVEIDWDVIRRFGKRVYKGTPRTVAISALLDRGLKQALYLKGKRDEIKAQRGELEFVLPPRLF